MTPRATSLCIAAFWRALVAALAVGLGGPCHAADKPNILFIMADDHAAHALSCYGSTINTTPNLDRLASQGMRFTNSFCTNAICTPMRAVILTGLYSHRNGVLDNSGVLPNGAFTVADGLRDAGYQTAIVGKWHLNREPTGFDYWSILPGQGEYVNPEFTTNGVKARETGYVTDLTVDKCLAWIRARDASRPFFLMCHFKAPHRPWEPDAPHARLFEDAIVPLPPTFDDDYTGRSSAAKIQTMSIDRDLTPGDVKTEFPHDLSGRELKIWKYQRFIKDYLRCIASVDDNVGRMMKFLDDSGLARNTIVIYTSDQGFFLGDHGWFDKRFMYEQSLRTPLIVRYPGLTQPGSVCSDMVLSLDFAPTMLDLAGAADRAKAAGMQGRSIREILAGHAPPDWRQEMYYRYYESGVPHTVPKHYGVRTARHKLIYFYTLDEWEMYDLQTDPSELKNLHGLPQYAEREDDLKRKLRDLQVLYGDSTGPSVP